jgi:NADPH:quinone reductase-like Zn-dependent oxidoreductase
VKAAVVDRYGRPENVRIEEVPTPVPRDDEVLVRVRVASVNRADLDGIEPRPAFIRLFIGLRAPRNHRIGIDVAGVVEAVGSGVTRFRPGDRVFADLYSAGAGAFAEFACAPERRFLEIPPDVTFEQAATLPHSGVLAIQGLRLRNRRAVEAGDHVMVVGASGNVGPFAVQLAKERGAHVTGVCRTEKVDFVRALGADRVIDYTQVDITRIGKRFDWILDTDSHHSIVAMRRPLKPDGVYVTLGGATWPILGALVLGPLIGLAGRRSMGLMLWWRPFDPADVATLGQLVADGTVRPAIDRRFGLDQVVDALRWVHDGHARGKVLVVVAHEEQVG